MPRPVLVDLPLEPFLRAASEDANLPIPRTGSKRSRSPSLARSIFTPAKRRILEQEALFSPSQSRFYRGASDNSLHPHCNALLHAFASSTCLLGSSPAGLSDTHPAPPCHPHALVPPSPRDSTRISPRLSTSPQPKSRPSPTTTTTPTRVSLRKTRSQTTAIPSSSQRQSARHTSTPSPKTPTTTMTMIPREMPPPPDRRSVHYPGFDVHLDTHIVLPCTRSKARAKAEADAAATRAQEGEAAKENVRPSAVATPTPSSTGKAGRDIVPRRSARLRTNNNGCVLPPSQKGVAPQARDRLRSTLHDSFLQL